MKIKICLLLCVCQLILSSANFDDEDQYRQLIRQKNRAMIEKHNAEPQKRFQMRLYDKFAAHTFEELQHLLLNAKTNIGNKLKVVSKPVREGFLGVLQSSSIYVNWTERGKVSRVTDQGYCGSCYAHAAVSDIETSFRFRNIDVQLSVQQIVDCSWSFGNYGCYGGWMGNVFDYVKINGITTETQYPDRNMTFWQGESGDCEQRKGEFRIRNYAYTSYKLYDCQSLANMIRKRPVTVAVSANYPFVFYYRGVFDNCDPIQDININHAVLLVGLVQNSKENYWILKNSWSTYWGEEGYMRLDRYKDYGNQCQICLAPHYSIL